ncbi:MAG TPA: hypothetical protein VHQ45_04045 [Gemmatimonadaceae bacterium]|jgi:hypothetical protein|nr:hypothetical protein [Gemmatimonadaceae bacterium]
MERTNSGAPTTGTGVGGAPGGTQGTASGAGTPSGAGTSTGMMGKATEKAHELVGEARQTAGERVESGLARGKTRAASTLGSVAQTLQQSGQQLSGEQQAAAGRYMEQAGQQVQRLSEFLHNTDVNEIVDRVEDVARRQPALFLGGAFAIGLIGARFIKSARRQQDRSTAIAPYRGAQLQGGTMNATPYAGAGFTGDRDVTAHRETAREPAPGTRATSPAGTSSAGATSSGATNLGAGAAPSTSPTPSAPSPPSPPPTPGSGSSAGRDPYDLT